MKGPDQRIKLDMRRIWECPQCQARRRVPGDIVSVRCDCKPDGAWMRLIETELTSRANRVLDEYKALAEAEEQS